MNASNMDETPVTPPDFWRDRLQRLRRISRSGILFASGLLTALLAFLLYNVLVPSPPPLTTREVNAAVADAMASATPPPAFSALVYQAIQPSLVLIQVKVPGKDGASENQLGSGVIIDDQGDILTALHVVDGATNIQVTFADGTQSSAQVTTKQADNDIAVLSAAQLPQGLVPAVLGNPNTMHVGDDVYAVGNPFGLYSSMSAGVISGFNRSFQAVGTTQKLNGLIQIDAAVNPGNSGGPLLNRGGQVIGIITGILNPTDQDVFIGIGFAVPIDVAGGAAGAPPY
jgi:S1-C subfamily serine protease